MWFWLSRCALFQEPFGLRGRRCQQADVHMGLLPWSRGAVALCGSQAGGWAHRAVLEAWDLGSLRGIGHTQGRG